jgi:hypothetical protein
MALAIVRQLRNARDYYRQGGWYEVALRLSQRGLLPPWLFLFTEDVIVRLIRFNERSLARAPEGYVYSEGDPGVLEELLDCSAGFDRELLRRVFGRFFREGARCFTVRQGGRVAGYMWAFEGEYTLTYDHYRRLNLKVPLDGKSVFVGNGLINENHRLKGLFQHLLAFIISQWPQDTRFYSAIERTNDRSLRSHLRVGFAEHIGVLCVSLFGGIRFFRRVAGDQTWRPHSRLEPIAL